MTTKTYKYWLLHNGADILARVDWPAHRADTFYDGKWKENNHVATYVTGIGGDTEFDEITEADARKRYPEAFQKVQDYVEKHRYQSAGILFLEEKEVEWANGHAEGLPRAMPLQNVFAKSQDRDSQFR